MDDYVDQLGTPEAFSQSTGTPSLTVDSQYLDGSPSHMVIVVLVGISGPIL